MSAFICGPDHFKALAIFAASRSGGYGNAHLNVDPRYYKRLPPGLDTAGTAKLATAYADVLYQENIRSVAARYSDSPRDKLPGIIIKPLHIIVTNADLSLTKYRLAPVALLKMCDCLEYQSCETDDYRLTLGFELLDGIRGAAIRKLAGYEEAPWDFTAPDDKEYRPDAVIALAR